MCLQVELLRDIINMVLKDGQEEGFGPFCVYSNQYEDEYPLFIEIHDNVLTKEIGNESVTIKRLKEGFLVIDSFGHQDTFTCSEISMYVDLWKKLDRVSPRTDYNEHIKRVMQSVKHLVMNKETTI